MAIQDKCSLLHQPGQTTSPANTQLLVGCVAGRRNETCCSHTCNRCRDKLRELNDQTIPKVLATPLRPEKMDKPKLCEDKDNLGEPDPDSDSSIATKYSAPMTGFTEFEKQNVLQEMMRKHPPFEDITHKGELEKKEFLINSQNFASHSFEFAGQSTKPQETPPDIKNLDLNLTASVTPAKVQNMCIEGNLHDELEKCKIFDQQPLKMKNQVRNILAKYSHNESILWDICFAYRHTGMNQIPLMQRNEIEICKSKIPDLSMLTNNDGEMRCAQSSGIEKNCDLHLSELSSESGPLIPVEDSYIFPSTMMFSGCSATLSYCKFSCTTENKNWENQHKFTERELYINKGNMETFPATFVGKEPSISNGIIKKQFSSVKDFCIQPQVSVTEKDGECRTQLVVTAMLNATKYEEFRREEQPEDGKATEKAEEEESEKRQIANQVEKLVPVPVASVTSQAKKRKHKKSAKKENAGGQCLHPGKKNRKEIGGYTFGAVKCKQHNRAADHAKPVKKSGKSRKQDLVDKTDGCMLKNRSALLKLTEERVARDFCDPKQHGLAQQPLDTAVKVFGANQPMEVVDQTDPAGQILVETSMKKKDSVFDKTSAGNSKGVSVTHPSHPADCFVKLQYSRYDDCVSKMDHYLRSQNEEYLGIWRVASHRMTGKSTEQRKIVTRAVILRDCINTEIMSLVTSCILLDEDQLDLCSASLKVVSSSSSAEGGNSGGSANSSSSGSKGSGTQQNGRAGWSCHRHGNSNDDDDDDDDDKNENRHPNGFPGKHASGDDKKPTENHQSALVPPADYKRYRKKQHGVASNEQLCHCLGQAGAGLGILRQSSGIAGVNTCLSWCLHDITSVTSPSVEDLACCTCAVLHSLLSHFAQSPHDRSCNMCLQLFTLIAFHIQECRVLRLTTEGPSDICYRMISGGLFSSESELSSEQVWAKVRKYLSCALAPILVVTVDSCFTGSQNEETADLNAGDITVTTKSIKGSAGVQDVTAAVDKISVSSVLAPQMQPVMPKHAALNRKPSASKLLIKPIPEEPQLATATPEDNSFLFESNSQEQGAAPTKATIAPSSTTSTMPATVLTCQIPVDDTGDRNLGGEEHEDIRPYIDKIAEQMKNKNVKPSSDDPFGTQKTYGQTGIVSMPEGQIKHIITDQNFSLGYKPTGTPGIGEVVYGTRQQLLLVARNWRMERDNCRGTGRCRYQHREEGVILDRFKKNLCILHTRYQKHHQWERLVHLGNGVTGKCHLCIDRTSSFKFCCKKIHILSYDDNELDIWSDLSHHNIVCFFGAIRHGERIYLFAEFIDGGNLTAVINEQWHISRRLSHWTALNYFRQLLDVLIYMQLRGVLHEDIKADNLLLREGTTEIVLADFGVAQRICHDHVPPGQSPAGSPAHWSPEKAASEGHGFPSDLWAAACVLIHMLSGSPPWIKRYQNADVLNFLIWSNPPPMDDVPPNVRESVRDLISCCLVKDAAIRPSAKQIRNHQSFQMLSQASSFFSTFVQPSSATPLQKGPSEPDPEKASGDIKTGVEAGETNAEPKTDFASCASALKLQEDQLTSMSQEKLSGTCCVRPECPAASSPSFGCKNVKMMSELIQSHTRMTLENDAAASGCEIADAACAERSVFMVFSQHLPHGQDETVFHPEDLPDVPPTLVTPVGKKGSLTISFQPVLQSPSQATALDQSGLEPYGTTGDSPTMVIPASPLLPLPGHWEMMNKIVTPDGAQPSRDIRVDDAVHMISLSAVQNIPKQTLPSSGEISSAACPLVGDTTNLKSTLGSSCQVQNDFVKAASDTSCTANLSMIPEDEEEASATNSREEHFWDFVQDNGVTCQDPVFGRHHLRVYQGCGTLPDYENALSTVALPSASPERILPNFRLLSVADSVTLQSGNVTGMNTSSGSSILQATQQEAKTQNILTVNWLAVRDQIKTDQHSTHNKGGSLKESDAKEEKIVGTETNVTRSSDDEHISSGDLFGPGPIKAEKQQHTSDTTQTSCSRKNPNLRLEMTAPTATACHTAGMPRETKQLPAPTDNRTKHPEQVPRTLSEPSGFTASPFTPSPQSAPVKDRSRSGSSPHVGSESSTPRSAYDQQEQEWNILQQEACTVLEFEPDKEVDVVSCIHPAYFQSYQPRKELASFVNNSEESEMLSILQGSINATDIAGHLLTFYSVQEEELFSMRVPPHCHSWSELVASVHGKIYHAGYQHFTLVDMGSHTSIDFFSPPDVRRIKVMEVSEDSIDTCWCENHLIL